MEVGVDCNEISREIEAQLNVLLNEVRNTRARGVLRSELLGGGNERHESWAGGAAAVSYSPLSLSLSLSLSRSLSSRVSARVGLSDRGSLERGAHTLLVHCTPTVYIHSVQ